MSDPRGDDPNDPDLSPWAPPASSVPRLPEGPRDDPRPAGDATLAGASSPPPPSSAGRGPLDPVATEVVPVATGASAPARPRRSRGRLIGALVGVVALLAAGAFAVVALTGDDDDGGAASPQEVGTKLVERLNEEDLLGVVDLLLPGEREMFRQPLLDLLDDLKRIEVLSDEASLDGIAGVDLVFEDVEVDEEPTNVDDISTIVMSGTSSATVDGDRIPLGDLLIDEAFDGERPEVGEGAEPTEFDDVRMAVVQRDGRWYLSGMYTIAVTGTDGAEIPDEGLAPEGADSPDAAVEEMLGAIGDLDVERIIALLDPTEAEALQRFAPMFLEDAEDAVDDVGIEWSIDDVGLSVEGSGGRRSVGVESLTLQATDPDSGDGIEITYADGCVSFVLAGDEQEFCTSDPLNLDDATEGMDPETAEELRELAETYQEVFDDLDPRGIAVHEVDGSWYVSPVRTMFDQVDSVLSAIEREEVEDLRDAVTAFFDGLLGGFDIDDLPTDVDDPNDTPASTVPDDDPDDTPPVLTLPTTPSTAPDETLPDDTVPDDDEFAALDACYAFSGAEGVQCVLDGIAAGTIDPGIVQAEVRHPECGVAEVYWDGPGTLPDAEFVALVEQASPCFLTLVAAGAEDPYDVSGELLRPACLEGRNWYNVFDDPDYDTRYFDCVSAARDELSP